jgi:hypothetical protein
MLFVTPLFKSCTARGSHTVAWCMVVGDTVGGGYVAELSGEWASSTRSILDAVLYSNFSKTLRNVGKYSPNESACHPRVLEKSGTALREPQMSHE